MGKRIKMQKEVKGKAVGEAFREFIQFGRTKNLSKHTLDYYERYYYQFEEFLVEEDATTTDDIDNALVMDFVESCGKRMKETSVNTCMRAIRAFLYYCMDLGYIQRFKIVIRMFW